MMNWSHLPNRRDHARSATQGVTSTPITLPSRCQYTLLARYQHDADTLRCRHAASTPLARLLLSLRMPTRFETIPGARSCARPTKSVRPSSATCSRSSTDVDTQDSECANKLIEFLHI
eukprot:1012008-Pleurochrysis_carterae.AAC.1